MPTGSPAIPAGNYGARDTPLIFYLTCLLCINMEEPQKEPEKGTESETATEARCKCSCALPVRAIASFVSPSSALPRCSFVAIAALH